MKRPRILLSLFFLLPGLVSCAGNGRAGADAGDTDSETGTGDDTSSDDTDTTTECEGIDFPVAGHPPVMMFVLDKSGSMQGSDPVNSPWLACSTSIAEISSQMDYQIEFGLLMYPEIADEPCMAPDLPQVPVNELNAAEIEDALAQADLSNGGTPTASALQKAYEYLIGLETDQDMYVILATDGAPNCSGNPSYSCDTCVWTANLCQDPLICLDDQGTYGKVSEYHDFWGINTYVIGVGGVWEVWDDVMSTIALLGGTGDYFQANTDEGSDELMEALQEIAAANTECTFEVNWGDLGPMVSQDPMLVNLLADGEIVPFSEDCVNENGWHWLDISTIELCPGLCEDYRWGEISQIRASFGCETIIE